MLNQACFC